MTPQWLISHPFGSPFAYNAVLALQERQQLAVFHTCLYAPFGWTQRAWPGLDRRRVHTHPWPEAGRLALSRLRPLAPFARGQRSVDAVGSTFDRAVSTHVNGRLAGVYGYEDYALHTFRTAQRYGLPRLYDLPIAYFREAQAVFAAEAAAFPEFAPYMQSLREPDEKLERKTAELQAASLVVCASRYTEQSVQRWTGRHTPTAVIPYGVELHGGSKAWDRADTHGPLRLFFAGRLDPRKGLHRLFAALAPLPPQAYELTLAGRWVPGFERSLQRHYRVNYRCLGQLPHAQLRAEYARHHLFVFPSLLEGFGLVLLEALAAGLPILTTERTAGPDLLAHGAAGLVLPALDTSRWTAALELLISDRERLISLGRAARPLAARFGWDAYRAALRQALRPLPAEAVA